MGADLIITHAAIEADKVPNWTAARDWIKHLDKNIVHWPAPARETFFQGDDDDVCAAAAQLEEDLATFIDDWEQGSRELASIEVGNWIIILTGGMTHGDAPSETYERFERLNNAGVLDKAGFDPVYKKAPLQ